MRDCRSHQPLCSLQTVKQSWSHALSDTSFLGTVEGPFSQGVPRAVWALRDTQSRGKHPAPSYKLPCCHSGALVLFSSSLCLSFSNNKTGVSSAQFSAQNIQHLHTTEGQILTSDTEAEAVLTWHGEEWPGTVSKKPWLWTEVKGILPVLNGHDLTLFYACHLWLKKKN